MFLMFFFFPILKASRGLFLIFFLYHYGLQSGLSRRLLEQSLCRCFAFFLKKISAIVMLICACFRSSAWSLDLLEEMLRDCF